MNPSLKAFNLRAFSIGFLSLSLLSACGSDVATGKSTQVLAKINGDEITVHQLNAEMQRMNVPVVNPQLVAQKMLGSLIERQLLVQEAIKLNIDRSPEVVQMLDIAKAQLYAQAYLARKLTALSAPSEADIVAFMQAHPEVFSRRKVFTTQDVIFVNDPKKVNYAQLQSTIHNLDELKAWLNTQKISYEMAEENLPSESLPQEALANADMLKVNDLLFMHDDLKVVARYISHITEVPLQAQQAKDMATKALNERNRQQLILDEVNRLKKLAKIEIVDSKLDPKNQMRETIPPSAKPSASESVINNLKGL